MHLQQAAVAAAALALASATACWTTPQLDLGPKPSGVIVDARMHFYDVSAATLSEARLAMAQQGPRSQGRVWSAVTRWRLAWAYEYDTRGTMCRLRNVRVRLQTTIEMPRWNPTAEPDSAMLEWWRQMNAGLAEHERGHAQIAMQAGGEIVTALDGLMGGNCSVLGEQANVAARRISDAANRKQVEYDFSTRHGATQIQQARRLSAP